MNKWQDETLSTRKRICLWLATHENEFTSDDVRKAIKVRKNPISRLDKVSQEISYLAREEKLTKGFHRGMLLLYKKVEGMDFDELSPRMSTKTMKEKANPAPKHEPKLAPGVKGVITHGVNDKRVCT